MSSLSRSPTPDDLSITPRDKRFGRDDRQGRWWLNGDPIASAFHTALSVTFPRGEAMFIQYGCGSCHGVKHVRKATGAVGPPLDGIAIRAVLAGRLDNNPANLQAWIRDPQRVSPGTAMPDLKVGARNACDRQRHLVTGYSARV